MPRAATERNGWRRHGGRGAGRAEAEAEYRFLSILFCDLVGSTRLSQRLDPEAMRDLFRRYQDAVAGAVTRYQGHVAKYLGDGVLAYFGWPIAHEDHAERAVRAGLESLDAVAAIGHSGDQTLAARVGIATGRVIVGDLVGESGREEAAVAGETANLAARIQAVARPGQLLMAAETARLCDGVFELEDTGPRDLKDFDRSRGLFLVRGERQVESRFEATRGTNPRALVGRTHELAILDDLWATAQQGRGRAVLIAGEPGIGKSRLVEAFLEHVDPERAETIRLQCSPYHTNSSLHPVVERLRRLAGFAPDDAAADRLGKLERLVAAADDDVPAVLPLFAELLSVDLGTAQPGSICRRRVARTLPGPAGRPPGSPGHARSGGPHRGGRALDRPDHERAAARVLTRIERLPVLLVVTHRPEWSVGMGERTCGTSRRSRLGRLDQTQIARSWPESWATACRTARLNDRGADRRRATVRRGTDPGDRRRAAGGVREDTDLSR